MATTNIQIFNENQNNALLDSEYRNCTERNNGFLGVLARANVFNKFCYQTSLVCKAIADFMVGRNFNANDSVVEDFTDNFEKAIISVIADEINSRVPNTRAKNTLYNKGDIATDASLPLWGELECITSGTTSSSDFSSLLPTPVNYIGLQIQDGSVLWVLRAKRFSSPKNTPIPFNGQFVSHQVLESGTAKTYYVPVHPEIGLEMLDYRYCDGQTVGGFTTINMQDRFLMCKNSCGADNGEDGTDEISIEKKHLPTDNFGLSLTCNNWEKTLSGSFSTNEHDDEHTHTYGIDVGDVTQVMGFSPGIGVRVPGNRTLITGGINTGDPNKKKHNHSVKVEFGATHRHNILGTVKLNSNAQQKISIVSRHYKIAFIQRIY